jgi:hypothetical protein
LCGLAILHQKSILWQKKNNENSKYFTMQKYNLQKSPPKETKILQDIITNSITNLKFQTQAKIGISSFKTPPIKIELLLFPRGQNPLSYYTL